MTAAAAAAAATVMYRLTPKKLNVFIRIYLWRGAHNIVWCTPDGRLLEFIYGEELKTSSGARRTVDY